MTRKTTGDGATTGDRGISPVVGTVLLVAIAVVIVSMAGFILLDLTETHDPAPSVTVRLEAGEDPATYFLRYESGNTALGNRTELQGVLEEDTLHGRNFTAGDEAEVLPLAEEVRLVWHTDERSYTLQTYTADPVLENVSAGDIDHDCAWAEEKINNQGDLNMNDGDVLHCDVVQELDLDPGVGNVDLDFWNDAILIGSIDTDGDVDLDSATVVGDVTTDSDDITITDETTVYGDVVAQPNTNIDIDGDSSVGGAVVVDGGSLSLDSVTVAGHVYVDVNDISGCSGGTTIGPDNESCSEYEFRDPADY
jgi:flagellin-like protein